ncbi:V3/V1b-type arginine vasotocin receptor [Pseudoalteromonas sp. T1lg75]|uniref:V3/V1b-type arginine vasotocin receptor n=1 Tax=Pseudoalteromonas sp. T1lg75 TaxID=2077102 RepID=UPI000CF63A82|nr:V3/V1b-type arginine vasotocin receptor [Pseudoalteromonas sp. T1lg75]
MDLIYTWINELSSFHQSILGAAVFSVSSWLVQKAYKKAKSSGSEFMEVYSELDVHKHVLHKEYVRSGNIQYASFGASIALLLAARWVMLGILIMVFFFGINSIVQGNWLYVAAAWFTFNCMLEARNWLKDSSDPKNIAHVPEETANKIYSALKPKEPAQVESTNN